MQARAHNPTDNPCSTCGFGVPPNPAGFATGRERLNWALSQVGTPIVRNPGAPPGPKGALAKAWDRVKGLLVPKVVVNVRNARRENVGSMGLAWRGLSTPYWEYALQQRLPNPAPNPEVGQTQTALAGSPGVLRGAAMSQAAMTGLNPGRMPNQPAPSPYAAMAQVMRPRAPVAGYPRAPRATVMPGILSGTPQSVSFPGKRPGDCPPAETVPPLKGTYCPPGYYFDPEFRGCLNVCVPNKWHPDRPGGVPEGPGEPPRPPPPPPPPPPGPQSVTLPGQRGCLPEAEKLGCFTDSKGLCICPIRPVAARGNGRGTPAPQASSLTFGGNGSSAAGNPRPSMGWLVGNPVSASATRARNCC